MNWFVAGYLVAFEGVCGLGLYLTAFIPYTCLPGSCLFGADPHRIIDLIVIGVRCTFTKL